MKALIFKYDDFKKSSKKALNDAYMSGKPVAKLELKKNKKAINLFFEKIKTPARRTAAKPKNFENAIRL